MTTTPTADRILHALFELSRATSPIDASRLGYVTGSSATQAAEALVALEELGWVDASRARLTFLGLARAVQAGALSGGGGGSRGLDRDGGDTWSERAHGVHARRSRRTRVPNIAPPLAAGATCTPVSGSLVAAQRLHKQLRASARPANTQTQTAE